MSTDPAWLTERVARSQAELDRSLDGVREPVLRAPSTLPGWSRAHVLAHLVGNATAMSEMFEGYAGGRDVTQYGGSPELREADIQSLSALTVGELTARVRDSGARCLAAYRGMPDWSGSLQWLSGRRPAPAGPISRWREIEIHRIDLDLGYSVADWSAEFVDFHLARELPRLTARAPQQAVPDLPPAQLLGWLVGRGAPGLPPLPPWG